MNANMPRVDFGENLLAPKEKLTMKKPGNHPPPHLPRSRELHLDVCLLATQPAVKEPCGKRQKPWTTKSGKEWEVSKLGVQSFTIFYHVFYTPKS